MVSVPSAAMPMPEPKPEPNRDAQLALTDLLGSIKNDVVTADVTLHRDESQGCGMYTLFYPDTKEVFSVTVTKHPVTPL